jgi:NAD(P)-dependent dehydrogenase (short-subunit alcohol dehydrogenase family)
MHGKTALLTGASRGIGAAIAQRLLFEGANVVLFARNEARLHEVAKAPFEQSGRALVVAGDVTDPADRARLLEQTLTHYSHIDLLISCAATLQFLPFEATCIEQLQQSFTTNVFAPMLLTQQVVPHMRAGSSVIFISSSLTEHGFAGLSTYAATKGALRSFAKTLAVELAPAGIAVNSIAPGPTETELWTDIFPHDALQTAREHLRPRLLTGGFGNVEAIAEAVVFLAQIPTIRGEDLRIDCGYSIS